MSKPAAVVDVLRTVRGYEDDVLMKIKSESLEARRERIAAAAASSDWAGGPAELIATYPHHALVTKDGAQMRVRVNEDEQGNITFDKIEVFALAQPTPDVAGEVFETAKAAVDKILDDDIESATPMVAAIANAIYTSGDLHRRISSEVAKRSINRTAWWHQVVRERAHQIGAVEAIQIAQPNDEKALGEAIETLRAALVEDAAQASSAVKKLAERTGTPVAIQEAARDIVADLKYAIQALSSVAKTNVEEMTGIYEGVGAVANQLRLGVRFLASLSDRK